MSSCGHAAVLVVDDQPFNRLVMTDLLNRRFGLEVDVVRMTIMTPKAENGKAALERVLAREETQCCSGYEVIFMDIDMPVMDGIQVS